jgi:hypothetical protein
LLDFSSLESIDVIFEEVRDLSYQLLNPECYSMEKRSNIRFWFLSIEAFIPKSRQIDLCQRLSPASRPLEKL